MFLFCIFLIKGPYANTSICNINKKPFVQKFLVNSTHIACEVPGVSHLTLLCIQ